MSLEQDTKPFENHTCHVCRGIDFTWAKFSDRNATKIVTEQEGRVIAHFLSKKREPLLRICDTCGNVQIFVDQPKK